MAARISIQLLIRCNYQMTWKYIEVIPTSYKNISIQFSQFPATPKGDGWMLANLPQISFIEMWSLLKVIKTSPVVAASGLGANLYPVCLLPKPMTNKKYKMKITSNWKVICLFLLITVIATSAKAASPVPNRHHRHHHYHHPRHPRRLVIHLPAPPPPPPRPWASVTIL